jgi:hypothetical protein
MFDVMAKTKELGDLYEKGEYARCLKEIQEYWDSLPDPKEDVQHSYMLVILGARTALIIKEYDIATKWAQLLLRYNEILSDLGESEYLIGMVAYFINDMKTAKEYFLIADKKSRGSFFQGENPESEKLLKKQL